MGCTGGGTTRVVVDVGFGAVLVDGDVLVEDVVVLEEGDVVEVLVGDCVVLGVVVVVLGACV